MVRDLVGEAWEDIKPHLEDEAMWRIYFFDAQMNIVETINRLTVKKPTAYAATFAKRHGYYTYAIGGLR